MLDRIIAAVCAIVLLVSVSIEIGRHVERTRIASTCQDSQAGERLVATHQRPDGSVICDYSRHRGYGQARTQRRAT